MWERQTEKDKEEHPSKFNTNSKATSCPPRGISRPSGPLPSPCRAFLQPRSEAHGGSLASPRTEGPRGSGLAWSFSRALGARGVARQTPEPTEARGRGCLCLKAGGQGLGEGGSHFSRMPVVLWRNRPTADFPGKQRRIRRAWKPGHLLTTPKTDGFPRPLRHSAFRYVPLQTSRLRLFPV